MKKNETTSVKRRATRGRTTSTPQGETQAAAAAADSAPAAAIRQPGTMTFADEHVRVHAYFLYLQRGGQPGDPLEDWLRAERELTAVGQAR